MKKIYALVVTLLANVAVYATAPTSTVMLQHQGNVTFFDPDSIQAAVHASVDGDTIFLNEGTFPGFSINKKITVRGMGSNLTKITNNITIDISDNPTLDATLLEGLYLNSYDKGTIDILSAIDGLKIKKCNCRGLVTGPITNSIIDRCKMRETLWLSEDASDLTISNCYMRCLSMSQVTNKDIYFINCDIYTFSNSKYFRGTIMNSLLGSKSFASCSLVNCVMGDGSKDFNDVHESNCYYYDGTAINYYYYWGDCYTRISDETIIENNYFGNDGTIVGINGGSNPFTLDLQLPRVASHTLNVDNAHKTLNITVKLSE